MTTSEYRNAPAWQHERWPNLWEDAPAVPFGLEPREGVEFGCGDPLCPHCYWLDTNLQKTLLMAPRPFDSEIAIDPEYDLASGAAYLAAKELTTNWKAALNDGYTLAHLLKDVNDVIATLQVWRDGLRSLGEPIMKKEDANDV